MSAPERLTVALGARGYDIVVGAGVIADAGRLIKEATGAPRCIVVTDDHVAHHYLETVQRSLEKSGIPSQSIIIPAGEQTKSMQDLALLLDSLLDLSPDRRTIIVALGGGVVGDLAGFAASVLLRGIDFVQMPTTLLAQIDSAVGGKTGVNTRHGKNLVGSFHQPRLVIADTATLATLPPRQLLAGYAEMVKYGLINDEEFFRWLESNGVTLLKGDAALLRQAIYHCCRAKADIVAQDEKESGGRALLNLGHTFGHALEAETGFGDTLLHGEAVAIGMVMAFSLACRMGLCPEADLHRVKRHLTVTGLPVSRQSIRRHWDANALLRHFQHDKKAERGKPAFILPHGIGKAAIHRDVPEALLRALLSE